MNEIWKYISFNHLGIIGILVSGIGLLLAFLQIRKIANRTEIIDETYKKAIKDLENNETFINISTTLQKVESIKSKIQENKIEDLKNDLPLVAKLLVTLQLSLSDNTREIDFESQKNMCTELELKIMTGQDNLDKSHLSDEYVVFSQLELYLTKIHGELKYRRK